MPKLLCLMRHAQSAEKQPGQADKDRELTSVGMQEALQIGGYLFREKIFLDAILTSPAERATQTARLLSDAMKSDLEQIIQDEELFQASVRTFLDFLRQIDDSYSTVLCIAHNPTLSYIAEFLSKAEIGDIPPAGMAMIEFTHDSWRELDQGTGTLIKYVTPKSLQAEDNES
jgi:phosphohistidine phosphatase